MRYPKSMRTRCTHIKKKKTTCIYASSGVLQQLRNYVKTETFRWKWGGGKIIQMQATDDETYKMFNIFFRRKVESCDERRRSLWNI